MDFTKSTNTNNQRSQFNLGTFGGFSFRDHCPIRRRLTLEEVLNWKEATDGKACFWPTGDHFGMNLMIRYDPGMEAADIRAVVLLLEALGGDSIQNFLRIYFVRERSEIPLYMLDAEQVLDREVYVFDRSMEAQPTELLQEAAVEVMRARYPDAYQFLREHRDEGFHFNGETFLNPRDWFTQEFETESRRRILIVISRYARR